MKKGSFIVFEGPDGSGKSTVSQAVYQELKAQGWDVVWTREPGGSRIAEAIRDLILDPNNTEMDAKTEALLYAASRRQHLREKVLPALASGQIVLCDRFVDSSLAYQAYGRQIELDEVKAVNNFAIEGHYPDLTVFLDIDAKTGLDRIADRKNLDRLDREGLEFHQRVFAGYQQVLKAASRKYRTVDASASLEQVIERSLTIIKDFIDGQSTV